MEMAPCWAMNSIHIMPFNFVGWYFELGPAACGWHSISVTILIAG